MKTLYVPFLERRFGEGIASVTDITDNWKHKRIDYDNQWWLVNKSHKIWIMCAKSNYILDNGKFTKTSIKDILNMKNYEL